MPAKTYVKAKILSLAIFTVLVIANIPQPALAEQSISVSTDRASYGYGEKYTISGRVAPVVPNQAVSIQIKAPGNSYLASFSVVPGHDGRYSYPLKLGNRNIEAGTFAIIASYVGIQNQTRFSYLGIECPWYDEMSRSTGIPIIRAPASSPVLLDASGKPASGAVKAGQQVQVKTEITNLQGCYQPFAYLVQIQDANGTTIALSWINGTLSPGQSLFPAQSWIPRAAGVYTAEIYFWQSLENPNALRPPSMLPIDVMPNSDLTPRTSMGILPITGGTRETNFGTLSGEVVLAGGPSSGPKANYEVDVYATDGTTVAGKAFSDSNARYSVQIPAGNYMIYVQDYPQPIPHPVSISPGKTTIFNIAYGSHYK